MHKTSWIALVLALQLGCFGGSSDPAERDVAPGGAPVDASGIAGTTEVRGELLAGTWPILTAAPGQLDAYGNNPAWVALVMKRDYRTAIEGFAAGGGLPLARAHADAAGVYFQAALLAANSLAQTYGETPQPTDPAGTAHLLTVAYAILGRVDDARAASARLPADDPSQAWHGSWKTWLAGGAAWPPDLAGLPTQLPAPTPGTWVEAPTSPHYELPEQGGSTARRPMGDPGALLALAFWHEAAARAAAPDDAARAAIATYLARVQLPAAAFVAPTEQLPPELLFGADYLSPTDAAFLAEARRGATEADAAIAAWGDRSVLAALARAARVADGMNDEALSDGIARTRDAFVAAQAAKAGQEEGHHRTFGDLAANALRRNLAIVSDAVGDREAAGMLRILAMETDTLAASCPDGLMQLAAWDAGNRYPQRAQDIVHTRIEKFPSLEIARSALDVLAIRVSRETPSQNPGM